MAISANTLTLAQYANQANDPLISMVVNSLYTFGSVLRDVPIATRSTLKINGTRLLGSLPTINWRKINESSVTASATATPYSENVYPIGNNIDIDRMVLADQNSIGDPRVVQLMAYMESLTYDVNDKFFNNGPVTGDIDAPIGIRYRLDNPTAFGIPSACKIDGGGVVMTPAGLTAATAGQFFELVDQALQEVGSPDGVGCKIYVNRLLKRRMDRAIKTMGAGGGFDMARDAFDRTTYFYRGAEIVTVGVKADQTTNIITSTETSAGANGSSDYTSFYVVNFAEDRFIPWQMAPLSVVNLQLTDEPTINRTYIEWSLGFAQNHNRALARAYDIKVS